MDRSLEGFALANRYVRMLKVGRFVYVMCQLIVPSSFRLTRVKELDDVRRRILAGLEGIHPNLVLDAVFTEDEALTT